MGETVSPALDIGEKKGEHRAVNLLLKATQHSRSWALTLPLLPGFSKEESSSAQSPWSSLHAHPGGQ